MKSNNALGLEHVIDTESTVRIPHGFASLARMESATQASEDLTAEKTVYGLVRPMEELEQRVSDMGMYRGPLYPTQARELVEDLKKTFAEMKTVLPETPRYDPINDFGAIPKIRDERRKSEYRHNVHAEICDLMEKPSLPLTDLAPHFISERVNERTAFSVLMSIGDSIARYNEEKEAREKTPGYQPPSFITLTKLIGLIRAYAENSYENFRKVHPDSAEVISRYFSAGPSNK